VSGLVVEEGDSPPWARESARAAPAPGSRSVAARRSRKDREKVIAGPVIGKRRRNSDEVYQG
jgi:hypothetical protein